jgi:organic hydroperoxide reductase OsmC/OhrA
MTDYKITAEWRLKGDDFAPDIYNRDHILDFGNQNHLCASATPDYHGNPLCVNAKQTLIAALASCHMLTFLALASKRGFIVTSYTDEATGNLGKNEEGRNAITKIELHPSVVFFHDKAPAQDEFDRLQHRAHEACFIANSLANCVQVIIIAHFETTEHFEG